ncbi:MAG: tRNA (guanine-N7)-methyltransferase, partial [Bdellovibrionaceae bacterium]|nr:tRNA (guanine-N7)-methyltransferase [Pseudobdellovibrionaceae bacterium]
KAREVRHHNAYTLALINEYAGWAFDEEQAFCLQGKWRSLWSEGSHFPLDLEIGTGNGTHFAHRALTFPQRLIVGIELKFKPLIQTIRRTRRLGCNNARVARLHAFNLDLAFAPNEIDDVFCFFPDPWVSPRKPHHRILNPRVIDILSHLQKPKCRIYFKTDSREAFEWSLHHLRNSRYQLVYVTYDLHQTPLMQNNFITQFESIFLKKQLPICYLEAENNK